MSGAYVAKPAVTTDPDVPAGWDFSWTFPGPFPPGYEPELTLSLDAPAEMVPGESVSDITAALRDQVEFATQEPDAPLSWSATLSNPGRIGLKLSGAEDYSDSISQDYSDIGDDFWGGEPTFEFDVSLGDVGKTITLDVTSIPFMGHPVTASAEINVVLSLDISYAIFTATISNISWESGSDGIDLEIRIQGVEGVMESPYSVGDLPWVPTEEFGSAYIGLVPGEAWSEVEDSDGDFSVSFPVDGTARIIPGSFLEGYSYAFYIIRNIWVQSCTITLNVKLYTAGGELKEEYEKVTNHSPEENRGYYVIGWLNFVNIEGEQVVYEQWE